jgi:hypothetical protein
LTPRVRREHDSPECSSRRTAAQYEEANMGAIFGLGSAGRLSAACCAQDGHRLAGVGVKAGAARGPDAKAFSLRGNAWIPARCAASRAS